MEKNKVISCGIMVLICLICFMGCQQPQNEIKEEKKPVMDEELAGSWVNDNTGDIIFYLDKNFDNYEFDKCYISAQSRIFPMGQINGKKYLSINDVSSDTSYLFFKISNIYGKDNSTTIFFNVHYVDGKLKIKYLGDLNTGERCEEFKYLEKNSNGTYSKKK